MMKNRIQATAMVTLAFIVLTAGCASTDGRPSPDNSVSPIVNTKFGAVEGLVAGDILSFKGIPYAAPPVGDLRWRPPQPVAPWTSVRPATKYGPDCMQKPIPGDAAASGGEFGEDCLFVNVWRPAATKHGAALPVLVWIHGGGFLNGGSSAPMFDGSDLAHQGLVVVSLNYRLGRLGFFMHPALTATGEAAAGNYGFLDQLAALQWVQRNIAGFGGDAQQVTIAGESAGGISVLHLLTSPASEGLFHRAVVMSGRTYLTAGTGAASAVRAEQAGLAFAQTMGITETGAEALAALRALPVEKVNGDLSMEALLTKPDTYAGGPILDGRIVTGMPGEALRKRAAAKVPVLIGTTSDDLPVLFPPRANPLSFFGPEAPAAQAAYFTGAADPVSAFKNIAVDMTMHEPARFVARQMTAAGQPIWLYRFAMSPNRCARKRVARSTPPNCRTSSAR